MDTKVNGKRAQQQAVPPAPIGEIVEASTTGFKAVAAARFDPPPFGTFVRSRADVRTTFGIVSNVEHVSIDPTRRAIPLGRTWDELRREQPQVLELLTTEFDAVAVAFREDDAAPVRAFLPPVPPRIHDFVYRCGPDDVAELTGDLSFIRTLAESGGTDELIAAAIRAAASDRDDARTYLLRAGREVADLYRQDYERARSILRRLDLRVAGDGRDHSPPSAVAVRRESEK
jgi:hypothetical protein